MFSSLLRSMISDIQRFNCHNQWQNKPKPHILNSQRCRLKRDTKIIFFLWFASIESNIFKLKAANKFWVFCNKNELKIHQYNCEKMKRNRVINPSTCVWILIMTKWGTNCGPTKNGRRTRTELRSNRQAKKKTPNGIAISVALKWSQMRRQEVKKWNKSKQK